MNIANTFARIRKLFPTRKAHLRQLIDLNEHLRRDLGVHNLNSDRRVHERAPHAREILTFGPVTRAP